MHYIQIFIAFFQLSFKQANLIFFQVLTKKLLRKVLCFLTLFKYKQCFSCKEKQLSKIHLHANIWVNLNVINGEKNNNRRHTFVNKEWKKESERPTEILPIHLLFLFLPWAFSFGTFALWITAALKIHENPFWIRGTGLQAMKLSCFRLIISKQSCQHMGVCLHDLGCRARSVPSLEPNINVYALLSNHVCNYFSPRSRTCCQLTANVNTVCERNH